MRGNIVAFCENCGEKVNENDLFCENCGTKVIFVKHNFDNIVNEVYEDRLNNTTAFSLFQSKNWRNAWITTVAMTNDCEIGIILTREKALLKNLCGGTSDMLHSTISDFIKSCRSRRILYYYLDLDNCAISDSVNNNYSCTVDILKKIDDAAHPKYLFILGNEKIINVAKWKDKTGDDTDIESDWCYTSLSTASPWECGKYDFANALRVGRLPVYDGESFAEFNAYFSTINTAVYGFENKKSYGLSALAWEKESEHEYNTFAQGKVDVSPNVTLANVKSRFSSDTDTYFFNLHGSDETEFWYGQQGESYPQAVAPHVFNNISVPFVLAVEACYGARYTNGLTAKDSILLNAMTHKCISFLGSSRIAYGNPNPPGSCADDITGEFLRKISAGETVGDAFIFGIKKIVSSSKTLDDAEVKTIAEFNLYGDPSISINTEQPEKNIGGNSIKGMLSKIHRKVEISLPDIRTPVRMALANVDAQIEQLIDEFAFNTYFRNMDAESVKTIQQKVFRLPDLNLNQKVFTRRMDHFSQIVKIYFDDTGKIKKVYESK